MNVVESERRSICLKHILLYGCGLKQSEQKEFTFFETTDSMEASPGIDFPGSKWANVDYRHLAIFGAAGESKHQVQKKLTA